MGLKRLFNTTISRILFKNILVFDLPKLGLTLNFQNIYGVIEKLIEINFGL